MPKDERKILDTVRLTGGRGTFSAGQEDELEAALTAKEIARLTERGVISGFGGKAAVKPTETPVEETDALPEAADTVPEEKPKGKGK